MAPPYYPTNLESDAPAALNFLRGREDVNSRAIGFWSSSEGGMLATQVTARSKDVAFVIDSSGFMGPLGDGFLSDRSSSPESGLVKEHVEKATTFTDMWLRVARTGRDWDEFVRQRDEMRKETRCGSFSRAAISHCWILVKSATRSAWHSNAVVA